MFSATPTLTIVLFAFIQPVETSPPLKTFSFVSKKWYVVNYNEEMVRSAPKWEEDAESPPLSPRKAAQLATKMKDSLINDSFFESDDDFRLQSLSLVSVKGGWVWQVLFLANPKENIDGVAPPINMIGLIVLMDGQVPKPVEAVGGDFYGTARQPDGEPPTPKKSGHSK